MISSAPCHSKLSRDIQEFSEKEATLLARLEENQQYRKWKDIYRPYSGVSFRIAGTPSRKSPPFILL